MNRTPPHGCAPRVGPHLLTLLSAVALIAAGAGCDDPVSDGDPMRDSASDSGVGGRMTPANSELCDARGAAIAANTGNTITVSPAAGGLVHVDGSTRTLRHVVSNASPGDTILLEDGLYEFPPNPDGDYTGLYFTTPDITLRSVSGDPTQVVIDSAYGDHGGTAGVIVVEASGVVLSDFTVRRSVFHLIHLKQESHGAIIHNVHLVDGGQQFLKASPGSGRYVDDAEVSCSEFRMTVAGRDNVWGIGAVDGGPSCYTGGIDTHNARSWNVHDNYFEGIYCNPDGVQRPVHGQKPDERNDRTYVGGLAEHAIHMWDAPEDHGHDIDRNLIVNCARGIGLGLNQNSQTYDTAIRNNVVFSEHAGSREHDVGIIVEQAHDTQILNNTVFFSSASAYGNAIEYRWPSTSGLEIRNNLVNQRIRQRNDAPAALSSNVIDADASWFVDASVGDMHLATCDLATVVGAGEVRDDVDIDFDGDSRGSANDIGADDCADD